MHSKLCILINKTKWNEAKEKVRKSQEKEENTIKLWYLLFKIQNFCGFLNTAYIQYIVLYV